MSELVNRHLESMAEEVIEMKRTKLFNSAEVKEIIKRRREYEYKINGVSKNLEDFTDYILYEKVLLRTIRLRRDKKTVSEKKNSIEHRIIKRIKTLYDIALQRYSNDFNLCLSFFKFCKQTNYNNVADQTIQKMINNCSQNPEVWKVAAGWYAYDQHNVPTALKVLHKGVSIHRTSKMLYMEAIKLELLVVKDGRNRDGEEVKREILCKKIETYVKLIFEKIYDVEFFVEILDFLENYDFTDSVQNMILSTLQQKYSHKAFSWHTLAQRKRKNENQLTGPEDGQSNSDSLQACNAVYEAGLNVLTGPEKTKLWSFYLDYLIKVQHENRNLRNVVKAAFVKGSEGNCWTEKYYVAWLELVDTEEEAITILDKGLAALPHSVNLWKLRLKYATIKGNVSETEKLFNAGESALKENSLPLWQMFLRFHMLLGTDSKIESTYITGIKTHPNISQVLKPQYIEWLALSPKGIGKAREEYDKIARVKPFCKELHLAMAKMESAQIVKDHNHWLAAIKLACAQFGEEDVDVWIEHLLYYVRHNGTVDLPECVASMHNKAEKALNPLLFSDFKERYNKIMVDYDVSCDMLSSTN